MMSDTERKAKNAARARAWRAAKKAALANATTRKAAVKKKPKPPAKRARRAAFDPASKITVLVDANPKRPGSAAHATFAKYATGMTIADFFAKGGAVPDLLWDIHHQYIKVAS